MLFHLFQWLDPHAETVLRVFRFPLFRSGGAFLLAFLFAVMFGPRFISWLHKVKFGQPIRGDGPETHQKKSGTPTMGGILILCAVAFALAFMADWTNHFLWAALAVTGSYGFIGFLDDFRKIKDRSSGGISGKARLAGEFAVSGLVVALLIQFTPFDTRVGLPFIKPEIFQLDLGWFYVPFAMLVIAGTANAVNLTDGLDGLAIVPVTISAGTFLILAYASGAIIGGFNVARYLNIEFLPGLQELGVLCGALMGAGVGFLWYNAHPAQLFMGDVGSLSLGGALGTLAILTKNELLSALLHGVFLMEALSVMAQVAWFKHTGGKRLFRMAPIHHHFEKLGWHENKVIVRFWIVSAFLAVISLATLKLR
ncbi:MAG: Phospho-N-acetylmuramoyl-pentapeptide-transferase [Myxococcota bacterium]|nr:Phospho-N-acetylmuramoyl-pentapeptide-transferase [Myxococcota bacterium]